MPLKQSSCNELRVHTGVGPGIKHIVQHGVVVHVKPVSDVSQSVWATAIRQVRVKDNDERQVSATTPASAIQVNFRFTI